MANTIQVRNSSVNTCRACDRLVLDGKPDCANCWVVRLLRDVMVGESAEKYIVRTESS